MSPKMQSVDVAVYATDGCRTFRTLDVSYPIRFLPRLDVSYPNWTSIIPTDRYKAVVPVFCIILCVALWFILRGASCFKVFVLRLVLVFLY